MLLTDFFKWTKIEGPDNFKVVDKSRVTTLDEFWCRQNRKI